MFRQTFTALCLILLLGVQVAASEIHEAAASGDLPRLRTLLTTNPSLTHETDTSGSLPLHLAALRGHLEAVQLLLETGAELSAGDRDNTTPLVCASIGGHLEIVKYLVSQGADLAETDNFGQTVLSTATGSGNLELVGYLIDSGADLGYRDRQGRGVLHTAAFRNRTDMLRHLVGLGADLSARDNDGMSVLCGAAYGGNVPTLETLIDLGCDVNEPPSNYGHTPVIAAIWNGHIEAIDFLLSQGADLSWHDEQGGTLLHVAAQRGQIEVLQMLIDRGLDINAANIHGETPIGEAAWRQPETVAWLVEHGANVNAVNDSAASPLMTTIYGQNPEALRILLDAGADPNYDRGGTAIPLQVAISRGDVEIAGMLLDAGADIESHDAYYNRTSVHFAAIAGNSSILDFLISRGADIHARDNTDHTPLYYATHYGHRRAAELLKQNGAEAKGITEDYGPPAPLSQEPAVGEATIWYLGHSGWAIRTANNFLIFDYYEEPTQPDRPCLANGHIDPTEIKTALGDTKVVVFSSHEHGDHYDTTVFDWRDELADATYVLGHQPDDRDNYEYLAPHTDRQLGELHVWTIHSTDAGVGYLIEVDGLTIFHAGDHANGEVGLHAEYTDEIDYLAGLSKPIDLAFLPITGCSLGTPESVREGVYYALDKLEIKQYFPQHAGHATHLLREFVETAREAGYTVNAACAENGGDSFSYSTNSERP